MLSSVVLVVVSKYIAVAVSSVVVVVVSKLGCALFSNFLGKTLYL